MKIGETTCLRDYQSTLVFSRSVRQDEGHVIVRRPTHRGCHPEHVAEDAVVDCVGRVK